MIQFKIGLDKTGLRQLNLFPERFESNLKKGIRSAMYFAEDKAKQGFAEGGAVRPPPGPLVSRSGHLRRSIRSGMEDQKGWIGSIGVIYAGVHEFGSTKRNIPARPFLKPAIEDNRNEISEIILDEILKGM